jgi:phage gp36-like protein
MAYSTSTEFLAVAFLSDAFSDVSTTVIDAELVLVSGIADSYLRKKKSLPLLVPYDPALVAYVLDLTGFRLMRNRGFSPANGADEEIKKAGEKAIAWFESVRDGLTEVGGVDSSSDQIDLGGTLSSTGESISWDFFVGRGGCGCE